MASATYMALLDTRCDWAFRTWFLKHQVCICRICKITFSKLDLNKNKLVLARNI